VANIFSRFLTPRETRAAAPYIPPRSSSVATPETALSLTAVFRSVQILATTTSNLGISTKRYATGMEIPIENPIFVNNPSLRGNRRELIHALTVDLALTGNAFLWKSYDSAGRVNSVVQLPSSAVGVRLADDTRIDSPKVYDYLGKTYSANEMEHLQLFPRVDTLRSPSPIEVCGKDIIGALDLRDYQSNWFSAAGVPTGVLKTGKDLNKAEADEVTTNWHTKQSSRQIAVLGNGFDYQAIALKPSEALFTEVSNQAVQGIARLFGIPARKLLTGVDGTSDTYSNLTDEEYAFFRETLAAYTRPIQDALSNCLPRGTRIEFLWEDLFKQDVASRIGMWAEAINAGIISPEFAAQKEGFI
jgi:HK97 family phage portal protein